MNSVLLTNLNHSAIYIPTIARFARPYKHARSNAIFQQTALYSNESRRGRELVKFPWIWPSDAEQVPKTSFVQPLKPSNMIARLLMRLVETCAIKLAQYNVFKNMNYANKIRDEMAPLVLGRIAESINEKDYDQMNRLMTPYLAKLYKNAVDDLDAQGFHMKLKIDVEGSDAINDFEWLQQGHPEGHDYTIPYSVRNAKYGIGKSVKLKVAIKRNKDGKPVSSGLNREFGGGVFATWLAFEYGFVVKTNVKVELYKHNRIVDSDSGMMQIPVAVSSPHYFGMQAMMDAVSGGENVQSEEPFRWKVCDLFYIADRNNADSIAKENENNNE